jgi:hypothetical protein
LSSHAFYGTQLAKSLINTVECSEKTKPEDMKGECIMKSFRTMTAVVAIIAGTLLGVSDSATAQGNKSNIIGGPLVWMQQGTSNRNVVKVNKGAVQQAVFTPAGGHSATPIPIPRPR